jgi:hypothetical protein
MSTRSSDALQHIAAAQLAKNAVLFLSTLLMQHVIDRPPSAQQPLSVPCFRSRPRLLWEPADPDTAIGGCLVERFQRA